MFDRLTQKLPTAATVRVDTGGVMLTRFPDGACAVAVSGQAMHLRAEEARTLAIVLGSLYPSEAA